MIGHFVKIQCKLCTETIYVKIGDTSDETIRMDSTVMMISVMGQLLQQGFTPAGGDYVCFQHRGSGDMSHESPPKLGTEKV